METYTTIRQTAKVVKPNSHLAFYEIRERPCAYPHIYKHLEKAEGPIGIWSACSRWIIWNVDGSIRVKTFEGELLFFDAIPTIASAVQTKNKGDFYQFHPDGSVTCRIDGKASFYSAPYQTFPVNTNSSLLNFWDSEKKTWLFECFDLTTEESYKKQYPELYERDDDDYFDSNDGGPRCCRGCWKKNITPERLEEIDLSVKITMRKDAIERNKNCIAAGHEKAKQKLALNMELLQKEEEDLAAFKAKMAAKDAAE
jgi:hypothetical protein